MQSALVSGFAGEPDAMVNRFCKEIGENAHVIATGGLAQPTHKERRTIGLVDRRVTLEGLRLLSERQNP